MNLPSPQLSLKGVSKSFGKKVILPLLDLELKRGEILTVLGPSGCGKSTLMRLIAGLEKVDGGTIHINGRDVTHVSPESRDIALVFQLFTLYPHLTVLDNVTFPLRAQGLDKAYAELQVMDWLHKVGLTHKAKHRPRELSFENRQRVAMVRALVRKPALFLFDEPLGSMDPATKETLWEIVRTDLMSRGATAIIVTHDQAEAMSMGDRVAVMRTGILEQCSSPQTLYDKPESIFVADFVGTPGMNLFRGKRQGEWITLSEIPIQIRLAQSLAEKSNHPTLDCIVGIRPEWIVVASEGATLEAEHTSRLGRINLLEAKVGTKAIRAWLPPGVHFKRGEKVKIQFMASALRFFDPKSGKNFGWRALESKC